MELEVEVEEVEEEVEVEVERSSSWELTVDADGHARAGDVDVAPRRVGHVATARLGGGQLQGDAGVVDPVRFEQHVGHAAGHFRPCPSQFKPD